MKIRYLPSEDRQNLHKLRHTSDLDQIAEVLLSVLKREYTLQVLWEYRKWFLMLSEEQLHKKPALCCGLAIIYEVQGDLKKAKELIEQLPEGSVYQVYSKLTLPGVIKAEMLECIKVLDNVEMAKARDLTLTAGRPSVINGIWDLTPYAKDMQTQDDLIKELIYTLYPQSAENIYDVMRAESLYWKDECYNSLVLLVGEIPFLKEKRDMRILFAALTIEIFIMVLNGQASSSGPMMENLRQQIISSGLEEYLPNIDALEAWSAMYDGDYVQVTRWLKEAAPDEYSKFSLLDTFRYMVKMRAYIISGKYLSVTALANRLMPLLEQGKRYMDQCELHIIWAMSDHAAGREDEALMHVKEALQLAETFGYDRLLADECKRSYDLLKLYQKRYGKEPYLDRIIKMTEKTTALHPRYLKSQLPEQPALSGTEMTVIRLLVEGYTNAEIAQATGTSVDNAKFHCKGIFRKLEVKNRHQAVNRAIELGILGKR